MNSSTRNTLSAFAEFGSKVVMGVGGLSFLVGGRALHEFAGVSRGSGELVGIALLPVCLLAGGLLKGIGENLKVPEETEDAIAEDGLERK